MINRPAALYYNGELIAIVTNPDPYPGGIVSIGEYLSPDEGLAEWRDLPADGELRVGDTVTHAKDEWQRIVHAMHFLGVEETIEPECDDEDED
jgi:hypothetical protein